jgi:hypothetical protein
MATKGTTLAAAKQTVNSLAATLGDLLFDPHIKPMTPQSLGLTQAQFAIVLSVFPFTLISAVLAALVFRRWNAFAA